MFRSWVATLAGLALSCVAETSVVAAPTAEELYPAVRTALTGGKCDLRALKRIIAAPDFATFESNSRAWAYLALGYCDDDNRTKWLKLSTAEPGAVAASWRTRFIDSVIRKDTEDALAALEQLAKRVRSEEPLNLVGDDLVYSLRRQVKDKPADNQRFLEALDAGQWTTASAFQTGDFIWANYAEVLLERGEVDRARRVAARVQNPGILFRMSVEKRFDPITSADPERFDLVRTSHRLLEVHRQAMALRPTDGAGIAVVAHELRLLGRSEEALTVLDSGLALPGPLPDASGDDNRNWVMDAKAAALEDLGRHDEALAIYRAAGRLDESGQPNVSQLINLSSYLVRLERWDEARDVLVPFGKGRRASPYGEMWVISLRACADFGLGRTDEAARALAVLRAREKDNADALLSALTCARDLDGLAAAYIVQLRDPQKRAIALRDLSRFTLTPMTSPGARKTEALLEQIRGRPDVMSAVQEVGRLGSTQLSGSAIQAF